jgi:hypothetical protein
MELVRRLLRRRGGGMNVSDQDGGGLRRVGNEVGFVRVGGIWFLGGKDDDGPTKVKRDRPSSWGCGWSRCSPSSRGSCGVSGSTCIDCS